RCDSRRSMASSRSGKETKVMHVPALLVSSSSGNQAFSNSSVRRFPWVDRLPLKAAFSVPPPGQARVKDSLEGGVGTTMCERFLSAILANQCLQVGCGDAGDLLMLR